jgi:phosphoglycolate phosphatase-like HAD superfamily hydrolase
MKLLLFDIDQTLLQSSRGHRAAFEQGFLEAYGVTFSMEGLELGGMTDREIIVELMRVARVPEPVIQARLDQCIRVMEHRYAEILKADDLVVLPGVVGLLEALNNRPEVLMGLVTGNLETIAWGKVRKVGLAKYFKLGGFGNEDVIRSHLVESAIQRAVRHHGFSVANNVYLFGDTPRDIDAGHAARAIVVAVATGHFSKYDLKKAGADWVIGSMAEKEKIFDILDLKSET